MNIKNLKGSIWDTYPFWHQQEGFTTPDGVFVTEAFTLIKQRLNDFISTSCYANAGLTFALVMIWCLTKAGARTGWMKVNMTSTYSKRERTFYARERATCFPPKTAANKGMERESID